MRFLLFVVVLLLTACSADRSGLSTSDAGPPDVNRGDVDFGDDVNVPDVGLPDMNIPDVGSPDMNIPDRGIPDMNIPDMAECMSGDSLCDGMTLRVCVEERFVDEPCSFGCSTDNEPHCRVLIPANVGDTVPITPALGSVSLPSSYDTDVCDGGSIEALAGGDTCVRVVETLDINNRTEIRGDNPLIVLASGDINVNAQINFRVADRNPADARTGGDGVSRQMSKADGGGGGGGGCRDGARGGHQANNTGGGRAGEGNVQSSQPLRAGGYGGRAGQTSPVTNRGWAGPGGGALQLTALGTLSINDRIVIRGIGGGGGGGDPAGNNDVGGGGGGGGGGMLVLESPIEIVIGPNASVNGDGGTGGGGGCSGINRTGQSGDEGGRATVCGGGNFVSGDGGIGGTQSSPAEPGLISPSDGGNGGGGGGGAGCVFSRGTQTGFLNSDVSVQNESIVLR